MHTPVPASVPVPAGANKPRKRRTQPQAPTWLVDMAGKPTDRTDIKTFAATLGVCPVTVRRWIAEGHLEATRIGRRRFAIDRQSAERFMAKSGLTVAI